MIGYALCGSFCTHGKSLVQLEKLKDTGYDIIPVMSFNAYSLDTRFGKAEDLKLKVRDICGKEIIHTIVGAEPLGPQIKLDAMVICPCTGNTLAKIAQGIADTPVCLAAKAHLRGNRPLVIALASNDALSANFKNIAQLICRKCVYFVPMFQDDPVNKPHSLIADFSLLEPTLKCALDGRQYEKIFI